MIMISILVLDKQCSSLTSGFLEECFQMFFLSQELKWRTGAATFWTLTLMPMVLALFVLLVNFKVLRPFLWIQGMLLSTNISFPLCENATKVDKSHSRLIIFNVFFPIFTFSRSLAFRFQIPELCYNEAIHCEKKLYIIDIN